LLILYFKFLLADQFLIIQQFDFLNISISREFSLCLVVGQ